MLYLPAQISENKFGGARPDYNKKNEASLNGLLRLGVSKILNLY
jgi:hypothetical protein